MLKRRATGSVRLDEPQRIKRRRTGEERMDAAEDYCMSDKNAEPCEMPWLWRAALQNAKKSLDSSIAQSA
jgi:hypothetical protein